MIKDLDIILRRTVISDLASLYLFQLDKEANHLAAFTSTDPADKKAYLDKHSQLLREASVNMYTIFVNNVLAGSVAKFERNQVPEITYRVKRELWNKGIATKALKIFLSLENTRPLTGRVAFDNINSQKVLEKCGFIKTGVDHYYANARQAVIEEYIYTLS